MKILIIVPVFNEGKYLLQSLSSFAGQTYQEIDFVLVNDASTDSSQQIIEEFITDKPKFTVVNLTHKPEHIPGAKIVQTFYAGLYSKEWKEYEILAKLDADIILPDNYFEIMAANLIKYPQVGIIGGWVYILKGEQWVYENISSKNHVRGPIKTYRTKCFEDMGGLRETLGWDNLDILLARMHGWEVMTVKEVGVKHLKPTAQVYKRTKAEKLGRYFYNIGLDTPLAFISCCKASWKDKSFRNFVISFYTFLKANFSQVERQISSEEIQFIRNYRWKQIGKKFK